MQLMLKGVAELPLNIQRMLVENGMDKLEKCFLANINSVLGSGNIGNKIFSVFVNSY